MTQMIQSEPATCSPRELFNELRTRTKVMLIVALLLCWPAGLVFALVKQHRESDPLRRAAWGQWALRLTLAGLVITAAGIARALGES